jgi:hypothetical protein
MAFAPDLLSAQAAEEILPLYFAGLRGSGCALSMDAIRAHAEQRPCRETGKEALNVAWVLRYRIIVSCAEFPQNSSRGNTSIFRFVNTFRTPGRSARPAAARQRREYVSIFEEDSHEKHRPGITKDSLRSFRSSKRHSPTFIVSRPEDFAS